MQRKYFTRANTSSGLVNLTENNLLGLENVYALKGGSKALKDRILKKTVKYTHEGGIDSECVVSPFDVSHFEGVILRDLNSAVVDADCITERAVTEIIDISDCISEQRNLRHKKAEEELFLKAQEAMSGMYSAYSGAKIIHDEWEKFYIENIDFKRLNAFEEGLLKSMVMEKSADGRGRICERFFGASTPDGSVNYIDNLTEGLKMRYFIKGRPGTGKSTFMKKLAKRAQDYNYDCEVYYCSFDKNSLDMVIIPELCFCVFDSTAPHELFPSRLGDEVLDFYKEAGLSGVDERLGRELFEVSRRYAFRISEGVTKLRLASGYMREAENYLEFSAKNELADKFADKLVRKIMN